MHRVALVLLLVATPALSQVVPEAIDAGVPALPPGRVALYAGTATALALATAALSSFAGSLLPTAVFNAQGRPDPLALAGGFVIAALLNVVVLHLSLPLLTTVVPAEGVTSSSTSARASAWRSSRWALIGAVVGLVTMTAGALAERDRFASGQWPMLLGAGTFLVSAVAFDVLEAVFAWQGLVASRQVVRP